MVNPVVQLDHNVISVVYEDSKGTLYETWRHGSRIYRVAIDHGVESSDSTFPSFLEALRALMTFMYVVENR